MTATRVATATLLAVVALTCDITNVGGPPGDNPDPEPELTPRNLAQGFYEMLFSSGRLTVTPTELVAYQRLPIARYEKLEAKNDPETGSRDDTGRLPAGVQTIVESDSPRDADLVLADEPLVRVGLLDGPDEYLSCTLQSALGSARQHLHLGRGRVGRSVRGEGSLAVSPATPHIALVLLARLA